ncbi:MAG: hypothetical protein V3571_05370 [Pseudodesulfovibrio sp.]
MRILSLFVGFLFAFPLWGWAASDVIATYSSADGGMVTLCTRDASHVRMDTSPGSYMLLSGDKVYAVSRDDDGAWQVLDMDAMRQSGGVMSLFGGGGASGYDVRYEKTGRTEKVAGYSGAVYTAVTYEDGKVVGREEVVLGAQAEIRKLTDGWTAMAARMNTMSRSFCDSMKEAGKTGYGGLLRYGDQMRLSRLQVKKLDNAYYELPRGAQPVRAGQAGQGQDDAGLSDDAKEIGRDAKDATKDEIKEGVRSVISNIFN